MLKGSFVPVVASAIFLAACAQRPGDVDGSQMDESQAITLRSPEISLAAHHDGSPPLMLMQPAERQARIEREPKRIPRGPAGNFVSLPRIQVQNTSPSLMMPTTILSFDGVGDGFSGPGGTFTGRLRAARHQRRRRPEPLRADRQHRLRRLQQDAARPLYGPVPINTLWSGFGGGCQTNNDGDPVVLYDPIADRWVISQFSVSSTPYTAVRRGLEDRRPDRRLLALLVQLRQHRLHRLPQDGRVARRVLRDLQHLRQRLEPSSAPRSALRPQQDADRRRRDAAVLHDQQHLRRPAARRPGRHAPAAGRLAELRRRLRHQRPRASGSSTSTGRRPRTPPSPARRCIAVASFADACNGGTCIPQSGTTQQLDSLADRLMFRLAYRNFGDHESLVVNHSVTAGSSRRRALVRAARPTARTT